MDDVAKAVKTILAVLVVSGPLLNYLFGFGMSNLGSLLEGI
jgi:hypothetical protein